MLKAAESAILYCPPDNVKKEYSEFPVTRTYDELKQAINQIIDAHPELSL
jgi:phosphoserine/homoserine phosphotransferase